MHLLSSFLFGLSSNTDNLVVGLSYGMRKIPIHWLANLLVGMVTVTGTVLSMVLGKSILRFLPERLAGIFGSAVIMIIGIVGLVRYFINRSRDDRRENASCSLSIREALLLGAALTVNNIGLGIGASITGLTVAPTALCSFLLSLLFLYVGNRIGRTRLSDLIGRFAEPAANLLMVGLGIYEIFI